MASASSRRSGPRGRTEPRLFTPPRRRLTRHTSRGYEVADFAEHVLGQPLLPWQRWLMIHALELNPDGSYRFRVVVVLVARQNGKTWALVTLTLWRMYLDAARLVLGAAQSLDIAREAWQASVDHARSVPDLAAEVAQVRYANGEQCLTLTNGARYRITAATRSAGRGLSVDQLNLDEIREQRDWTAWAALSKTTMARPMAQTWGISNAGDDDSVVLNHLREVGLSERDPSVFLAEWSAPEGADLDDPKAWAQANPGLGHTISAQAISTALATDRPEVFRTEVLCQHVTSLDEAISLGAWRDCTDPAGSLSGLRRRVVACVDVAPDGEHVTLAVAAQADDGRVHVEVAGAWEGTTRARAELPDLLARIRPRVVAWYPSGPAGALASVLDGPKATEVKGATVPLACQQFADLVASRRIVHPGDPLLDSHVAGAQRLHVGDGWRFVRRGVGHVDAAYAAAGAVHAALATPSVGKPRLIIATG